ncbi:hypothetical protein WICANDRAFT_104983 [Wickerhamomyces anomalus NRRL Y-366-8]|uniref:Outer spore wall assembly protein SHE10 n=1 Tax=Wickerhamomyces anomalus (strain ATCC 58044 / CBS 1984 / NCYC 433 / NRRL Y-366-8) TaxID=683960 RepID=A0A1E3P3T6_WICAA|nr:uncharacterized protein WICANDRAFT_104983 [Wickerhamomyces anomalus NRRL Y-366-8]ODQ59958.1 hypothetical protein WICANDRAFT_104983 [Wickerhamomyces anomalus NRRL Y-366-8]
MGSFVKKVLLLGILSYLVFLTVDFSAPEIQAVRSQVDSSFTHIKSHKYYNDYVIPAQSQLEPFLTNVNTKYISPSYSKATGVAAGKYKVYLSKHVDNVVDKVVNSPVFDKIIVYKPQLVKYYQLVEEKAKFFNTLAVRYTLIGFSKLIEQTTLLRAKACEHYKLTKPLVIDFYNNKAIPFSKSTQSKSMKSIAIARVQAAKHFKLIKLHVFEIYAKHVAPFYHSKVLPLIKPSYDKYLKEHVDFIISQAIKYYNLFRVEQIISLSHKCYSSAYEQIIKYGNSDSSNQESDSTAATSDSPTDFEEETEVPTLEITPEEEASTEAKEAIISDEPSQTETETETFAETATVSSYGSFSESTEDSLETKAAQEENAELTLSLADEITAWRNFIDVTVENIFKNFDKSIRELELEQLGEAKPHISKLLSNLSQTSNMDYAYINRVIYDINSTTVILENDEEAELDMSGKLIDHKISRQEFRELLAEKSESLKYLADQINVELKKHVADIEDNLEIERKLIVDIFEEFAEVSINEFSKKMMYSTFSNTFKKIDQEGLQDDDENFSDWREYVKAKNYLIKKREELIAKKPDFELINKLISEVAFTMKTLEQDSGNGFAILRAKANLAFQAREARERAEEAAIEAGEEITMTYLKTKTATIGDDGIVTDPKETEEVKVDTPVKYFVELSHEAVSQETKVDEPVKSFVQLSQETEESHETKVDTPERVVVQLSQESKATTQTAIVDAPVRSYAQPEDVETPLNEEEDLVEAVNEAAETDKVTPPEPVEPVGGIQQPIVDEAEPESEPSDEEIVEHQPDSEENEPEEDIVEHQPDSVEEDETPIPEDTPEPE